MKKRVISVVLALLVLVPAFAVLNEKDLSQTLSVLRSELLTAYKDSERGAKRMRGSGERQHARLVRMMQQSNELSLMLYSQKQDYTFDMTYALNEVSRQYEEFSSRKLPFDEILARLDVDIDRYDRLIHTLRSLPPSSTVEYVDSLGNVVYLEATALPSSRSGLSRKREARENAFVLDSIGRVDRDSCIFYAQFLLDSSLGQKEQLIRDSTDYKETADMLKSAYDYAQQRYRSVQNKIFIDGQTSYPEILRNFRRYWSQASNDARDKYSTKDGTGIQSQWRGPVVIGFSIFILFYLVLSFLLSSGLVTLLRKKFPRFGSKSVAAGNRFAMVLIFTIIIFALAVMFGSAFSSHNFFRMASGIVVEFAWMLAAIIVSLVIRLDEDSEKKGIALYLPTILMCLIIITFRIIFIPNSLINIVFPPILLLFTILQGYTLHRFRKALPTSDMIYGWVSLLVMVITTLIAFAGYVLLGVQLLIWWFFQLTLLQTINALYILIGRFYRKNIHERKLRYIDEHPSLPHGSDQDLIAVTWPDAFLKMALLPIALVLSFPVSLNMASGVFDLTEIFKENLNYPFLNIEGYISLTFNKIIIVVTLYFLFRFLSYLCRAAYRQYRVRSILKDSEAKFVSENQVNFTLAEHVIGILLWGIYVVSLFTLLRIPTAAIKVIGAGLATGLGFAMKDILNNFFYGVQLMSGRLRVGDYIECDGVRGKVDSINYQSTQIVSGDGSVMAFPNSTLFNKNFKNLTRNHSYEMLSFTVGVKYGSDVEQVRRIILAALEPLKKKDRYGREIIDRSFGIQVRFSDFGDSSVDLSVLQFVTVEDKFTYAAKAKELVYNALNENGIEIPFPQQDLYVKELPGNGD
ncbi:MAG: mechanosensitive ion channel family protein [Bacteroidales bacterium]|nr:mechanosensitive ion channel family protein [Bacteroidales bacterium]